LKKSFLSSKGRWGESQKGEPKFGGKKEADPRENLICFGELREGGGLTKSTCWEEDALLIIKRPSKILGGEGDLTLNRKRKKEWTGTRKLKGSLERERGGSSRDGFGEFETGKGKRRSATTSNSRGASLAREGEPQFSLEGEGDGPVQKENPSFAGGKSLRFWVNETRRPERNSSDGGAGKTSCKGGENRIFPTTLKRPQNEKRGRYLQSKRRKRGGCDQ